MSHEPIVPARWGITVGLLILTAMAVSAAPRLRPVEPEQAEAEVAAADLCVSIGKFECCYKEPPKE